MTKENVLFGIVGMLLGLIVGFFFANSVNQSAAVPMGGAAMPGAAAEGAMPGGHPAIPGAQEGTVPAIQAAIDKAKAEPQNFEAQLKAAELYYQIQRFEPATEFLKQANKIQPENPEVMVHLGNAYFDTAKYDEAEKWYTAALAKKEDINVRNDLGLSYILREQPNYDRAIAEFNKVMKSEPNNPQSLQNMTVAYTKKGDAAKAQATLAQLETADPTNTAIAKLREDIQKIEVK